MPRLVPAIRSRSSTLETSVASFAVNGAATSAPATITAASPVSTAGTVDVMVQNTYGTSAASIVDEFTYYAQVAISTTTLPTVVFESPYSVQLSANGGSGSYTWAVTSGKPASWTHLEQLWSAERHRNHH